MAGRMVFIVSSDPRASARPAEAVRIAAGVGVWKTVDVILYLRGAAVLALSEFPDDLVDPDNYRQYLPILGELGRPVYVQRDSGYLAVIGPPVLAFQELTDRELADLTAKSQYVARF